jgi:hypothetical protein
MWNYIDFNWTNPKYARNGLLIMSHISRFTFLAILLWEIHCHKKNKANAKRGISPRLKVWPGDLDLWPSIGFQNLLRTKYVPSLVKIHWRMLILECSQGCDMVKIWPWHWPLTLIGESGTLLIFKITGSNFYHMTSLWTL